MLNSIKKQLFIFIIVFISSLYSEEQKNEYLLLITGCGRSGTNYIAKLLKQSGLNIGWEGLDKDGISSWTMAVENSLSPSGPPSKDLVFKHIFHQVRHPLDVISSWYYNEMEESDLWDSFICKYIPQINKSEPFLARCAKYWYYWNLEASKKAEFRYKVEEIDSELLDELGKRLELKTPLNKKALVNVSKKANTWLPVESKLKWANLQKVLSKEDFSKIQALTRQYGYSTEDIQSENNLIKEDPETVFTKIFETKFWGVDEEGFGNSGPGATVTNAKPYMDFLSNFIKTNNIKTVVDLGCGEWTFSKHMDWKDVDYIGIDVVKSVIERNKKEFSKQNVKFIYKNILKDHLPSGDLMICKDVLQHLPNENVSEFIKQIKLYKYCLITNDVHPKTLSSNNTEIKMGDHHFIDLNKSPFDIQGIKIFTYSSGRGFKQVLFIDNTKNLSN